MQDSLVCRGAPCFVASRDGSAVCRVDNQGQPVGSCDGERYTYIDEAYLAMLQEDSAWARDNGIIELMPIAVVAQQQ